MALAEDEARELLDSLYQDWSSEREDFDLYDRYYSGDHPMAKDPARLTQAYRELQQMSISNWTRLVVDVVAERLEVQAITTSTQREGNPQAWEWWKANNLDFHGNNVHISALKHGVSYVAVGKPLEGRTAPRMIGQPATQVHVRFDPDRPDVALAALKVWQGRDLFSYATVYDAEGIYRFRSQAKTSDADAVFTPVVVTGEDIAWELRANDEDGGWNLPNDMGEVPFVKFPCQPDLLGGYTSEIAPITYIQDRINKTTFHRLLAQEFTAFPQRWVTGIDIGYDPDTGEPIEPFQAAVDRMWTATSEDTRFGQFPSGDQSGYISSLQADVQALATQSRTPPHYLTGGMGQFPSGESVRATEYGLSQKVADRKVTFGEAWGNAFRLAAKAMGDGTLGEDFNINVRWRDVEARTEGEIVDALLKMSTLGVPRRVLWERWGASPTEADEWQRQMDAEVAQAEGLASLTGAAPAEAAEGPGEPEQARQSAF